MTTELSFHSFNHWPYPNAQSGNLAYILSSSLQSQSEILELVSRVQVNCMARSRYFEEFAAPASLYIAYMILESMDNGGKAEKPAHVLKETENYGTDILGVSADRWSATDYIKWKGIKKIMSSGIPAGGREVVLIKSDTAQRATNS